MSASIEAVCSVPTQDGSGAAFTVAGSVAATAETAVVTTAEVVTAGALTATAALGPPKPNPIKGEGAGAGWIADGPAGSCDIGIAEIAAAKEAAASANEGPGLPKSTEAPGNEPAGSAPEFASVFLPCGLNDGCLT